MSFCVYKCFLWNRSRTCSPCGLLAILAMILLIGRVSGQSVMEEDLNLLPDHIESSLFVNLEAVSEEGSLLSLLPLEKMTEVEEKRFRTNSWNKPVFSSWEAAYKIMVYPGVFEQLSSVSVGIWNSPDLYTQRDYVVIRGNFNEQGLVGKLTECDLRSTGQDGVYIFPTFRPVKIQMRFVTESILVLSNDKEWIGSVSSTPLSDGEDQKTDGSTRFSLLETFENERIDAAVYLDGEMFTRVSGKDETVKMLLGPLLKSKSVCFYQLSGESTSFVLKVSYPDESLGGLGAGYQRELVSLSKIFLQRYQVENQIIDKERLLAVLESIETTQVESDVYGRYSLEKEIPEKKIEKLLYLLRGNSVRYWQMDQVKD